jgi:serine/threonine-protein phosphatase Stp1
MSACCRFRSVARTDTGVVRDHNEDNLVDRPEVGLWAVADGMGGHAAGDRASGLIRGALEGVTIGDDLEASLEEACRQLDRVHGELQDGSGRSTSGSTVVVLLTRGDRFVCGWAGDSRLYRSRGGRLEVLSHDHSLVQELVDSGTLTAEAARRHPLRNRITRAVGVDRGLVLEVVRGDVRPGDRYLLCSDGLHGVLSDPVLQKYMAMPDLTQAVDGMIAAVIQAGAPDNVTVVLIAAEAA